MPYPLASDREQTRDYVEMKTKQPELVLESVRTFADPKYGVDLFKLESPIPAADLPTPGTEGAAEAQALFDELGRAAGRPWVMLSAGAGMAQFRNVLHYAYAAGASSGWRPSSASRTGPPSRPACASRRCRTCAS